MPLGPLAACLRRVAFVLVLATWLVPISGRAQSGHSLSSASNAYDRGVEAYLAADYPNAARWFETAYRFVPRAEALIQAIRAHQRADDPARAATLALLLQREHAEHPRTQAAAERALEAAPTLVRVLVECDRCGLQLDGRLMGQNEFFVESDVLHQLRFEFPTGEVTRDLSAAAGETIRVQVEAPAEPTEPEPEPEPTPAPPPIEPAPQTQVAPIPLWLTLATASTALVLTGAFIGSAIDTLAGVSAYEANPTPEGLADGQWREQRTDWLLGAAGLMTAATIVLAFFTDYRALESAGDASTLTLGPNELGLGVAGTF